MKRAFHLPSLQVALTAVLSFLLGGTMPVPAQPLKPCGTAVLAKKRLAEGTSAASRRHTAPRRAAYTGEKRGLIILVEFPDASFQEDDPLKTWTSIVNQSGYADHQAKGSVSDYFCDQSYGQFRLTFDVVGPVEARHPYAYYGDNIDMGEDIGYFDKNVGKSRERRRFHRALLSLSRDAP